MCRHAQSIESDRGYIRIPRRSLSRELTLHKLLVLWMEIPFHPRHPSRTLLAQNLYIRITWSRMDHMGLVWMSPRTSVCTSVCRSGRKGRLTSAGHWWLRRYCSSKWPSAVSCFELDQFKLSYLRWSHSRLHNHRYFLVFAYTWRGMATTTYTHLKDY